MRKRSVAETLKKRQSGKRKKEEGWKRRPEESRMEPKCREILFLRRMSKRKMRHLRLKL